LANNARPSFTKRLKEQKRREQRQIKEEKTKQRKSDKENQPSAPTGVDPDIADIVPGPQPLPEQWS
jgi:hypothetical protein